MNARKQLLECGALFLILFALGWNASSDVVQTTSGDRYVGSIVAFTNGTLVFKSDIVGVVKIPKTRLAQVSFGSVEATNLPPAKSMANIQTNLPVTTESDLSKVLSQLQAHTNFVSGIQAKLLSDAGPEANEQFNKMVNGLLSGQISVADVRAQAAKAAADLREARKDLGEDSSVMIDSYLAILDRFLANSGSNTNR